MMDGNGVKGCFDRINRSVEEYEEYAHQHHLKKVQLMKRDDDGFATYLFPFS